MYKKKTMNKIKGCRAENRIDKVLNQKFLKEAFGYERWNNPKHNEIKTALRQAKTYIQFLNKLIKFYGKEVDNLWCMLDEVNGNLEFKIDEKNFWKHECVVAEKQNKEMFKQYFVENEKLKQELAEYKKFGLNKELEKLKQTENFENETR